MHLRGIYRTARLGASQLFLVWLCLLRGAFSYLTLRSPKRKHNDEMPQEMNVLCCYNCTMYQVHIVKKANKWQCKICGEKQSIQIVYFQGSGSDCRKQVQHLNSLKASQEDQLSFHSVSVQEFGLDCAADDSDEAADPCNCPSRVNKRSAGKWAKYLDDDDDEDSARESSDEKENVSSPQKNSQNEQHVAKKFRRFPTTQNSSQTQRESSERSCEPSADSSRKQTYQLVENSPKILNKWSKFLDEGQPVKPKTNDDEIPSENSTPSSSASRNQIFDEPIDDDFDFVVDF